jgi:deazaflavin-dependent oxidoreductase (nitroreductase family)
VSAEPSFTRRRAKPFLRLMLKLPVVLYRGPLAELMRSRCVLLLTTRGRRTGVPRTTAVSFMPVGDHLVVFSGWGVGSNWYRNIRADPRVEVTVGRRRMPATARLVEDPEQRRELMRQMAARSSGCGPPKPVRPLLKVTGAFDYEGEIAMGLAAGGTLPVVEIVPSA